VPDSTAGNRRKVIADIKGRGFRNILDLGCGTGMYGWMARRYLDSGVRWYGVDGYMPYLAGNEARAYDVLVKADVFDIVDGRISIACDCVLCMDVIEHFKEPDAKRLSEWLMKQPFAYMSTPLFWLEQDPSYGNDLERHQCWFGEKELAGMGWIEINRVLWDDRGYVGAFRSR